MEMKGTFLSIEPHVEGAVADLIERNAVQRIWGIDHTLWSDDPTEISDRLGWLEVVSDMQAAVSELETFAGGVKADGLVKAAVLGMGGSSLFPEVMSKIYGENGEGIPLDILDTTDPGAVNGLLADRRVTETLFIGASKSGTTVETRSQLATYWSHLQRGSQFTVITDPGSALLEVADNDGYRRVFVNRSDIGGRFAALSFFGMVPAALVGAPIAEILDSAASVIPALKRPDATNPGLVLGAAMAAASLNGRDKLTILLDPRIAPLGVWLEQLIAESTGKHDLGVIPVVDEPLSLDAYGDDRFVVAVGDVAGLDSVSASGIPVLTLDLPTTEDLGAQVLLWEFATAVAGAVLGINPFDQPNVASAKAATNAVLESGLPSIELQPVPQLMAQVNKGDYLAVCAYVDPGSASATHLARKRLEVGKRLGVATTFGVGPRYLHSTGQLHKGKPQNIVVAQIVGEDRNDVPIPGAAYTFSELKQAQAAGDYQALVDAGARVARVSLNEFLDW